MPWKIDAGSNGSFNVNVNLAGKNGTVIKTVTFATDKGTKHLLVRITIQPAPSSVAMAPGMREQNQQMAMVDRQAVFRGDCAKCHADVTVGKQGKDLYVAACGVCHEAEHRATMVADLHVAKQDRNEEYWRNWITNGKVGTLMPAFCPRPNSCAYSVMRLKPNISPSLRKNGLLECANASVTFIRVREPT